MTITVVKYLPKNTGAGTDYREIEPADQQLILTTCIELLSLMAQLDQLRDDDSRWVREQWWHKRSDKVHRGRSGQNTPCSVIGGIIHNMMFKTPIQRDLSDKQMEDLEYITGTISQVYPTIPAFRFQIGLG